MSELHTSAEQPEALRLAYEIGANRIKVQPTEAERLRFEQWMAGHCWKVGGTWDGTTYSGAAEHGDYLDPQAMHTRQLFAAWRDCAALRDQLEASQAQRVPLIEHEQALQLLAGLHPCPTIDGPPMALAELIFDAVQADLRALKDEIAKNERNLDWMRKELAKRDRWKDQQDQQDNQPR